jgi:cell division cycle-associated protein 7
MLPFCCDFRLQNVTPVSYSEAYLTKKDKPLESKVDLLREEGSKPEVYTEEHEKLLGSSEMSWTLFVDGVGKDGKRIYDPVKGKTCHQCRFVVVLSE